MTNSEKHFAKAKKMFFWGSILMMVLPPLGVITLIRAMDEHSLGKYYRMQENSIEMVSEVHNSYKRIVEEAKKFVEPD